jgi:hypothetical protein
MDSLRLELSKTIQRLELGGNKCEGMGNFHMELRGTAPGGS